MTHILKGKQTGTAGKFQTIVNLISVEGKDGSFLTNDVPRESIGSMDKYYVVKNAKAGEPSASGKARPAYLLKVRKAGDQKSTILTGLFTGQSKYNEKEEVLSGTDKNAQVSYMVVQAKNK